MTTIFPFAGSTTSASSSATPGSRRTSTATPSASTSIAYAGLETRRAARGGLRAAAGRDHLRPGLAAVRRSIRRASGSIAARRRRAGHRPGSGRRRGRLRGGGPPRGAPACTPPTLLEDEYGVYECATIRAYGDTTHSFVNRDRYRGVFAPGYEPLDPDRYSPAPSTPSAWRRSTTSSATSKKGKMNEWVEFYEQGAGLHAARPLRRQGHQHRVLGPDVEGGAERQRAGSSSRSTSRPQAKRPLADRGVPALLRRPRRAAHRHGHRRHHRDGPGHAATTTCRSCACRRPTTTCCPTASATIKEDIERAGRAGHPGGPRRRGLHAADLHQAGRGPADAVLRDHPAARARAASARATSRRCSRRSSASRRGAGRCEGWT